MADNIDMRAFTESITQLSAVMQELNNNANALLDAEGIDRNSYSRRNTIGHRDSDRRTDSSSFDFRNMNQRSVRTVEQFFDRMESAMWKGLSTGIIEKSVQNLSKTFTDAFGTSIKNLPIMLADEMGKNLADSIRNSTFGENLVGKVNDALSKRIDGFAKAIEDSKDENGKASISKAINNILGLQGGGLEAIGLIGVAAVAQTKALFDVIGNHKNLIDAFGKTINVLDGGLKRLTVGVLTLGGSEVVRLILSLGDALVSFINDFKKSVQQTIDDLIKKPLSQLKDSLFNYILSPLKMISSEVQNTFNRLKSDVESYIRYPFEILTKAAQELYNAWDSNIRTITATQGYTQSQYYGLFKSYSQRLQNEGYDSVISVADVMNTLSSVLSQGLSQDVAEEFAYQLTKYKGIIPTADFSGLAQEYASYAYTTGSIESANNALYVFAKSLMTASQDVSGGFSTVLKDGTSLFNDLIKVAKTAGINDISKLSSTFLNMQAAIGVQSPDLAQSVTNAMLQTLTGGNASNIVALRSLAGVNASNSEFLRQAVSNPSKIFGAIFNRLAELQGVGGSAFMETAEGLSSIFGLSTDAFARLDFNQIASELGRGSTTLASRNRLLKSGETTTSDESRRIAEINKMITEDSLAAVLSDAGARAMQQHLWDEELANKLMKSTFKVELVGSVIGILQTISSTIDLIKGILFGADSGSSFNFADFFDLSTYTTKIAGMLARSQQRTGAKNYDEYKNLISYGNTSFFKRGGRFEVMMGNDEFSWDDIVSEASNYGISDLAETITSFGGNALNAMNYKVQRMNAAKLGATSPILSMTGIISSGMEILTGSAGLQSWISSGIDSLLHPIESISDIVSNIGGIGKDFFEKWTEKEVSNRIGNTLDSSKIDAIRARTDAEQGEVVEELVDTLRSNNTEIGDKTDATNVLLAEVVHLLTVISNQGGAVGGLMPETMNALGRGGLVK